MGADLWGVSVGVGPGLFGGWEPGLYGGRALAAPPASGLRSSAAAARRGSSWLEGGAPTSTCKPRDRDQDLRSFWITGSIHLKKPSLLAGSVSLSADSLLPEMLELPVIQTPAQSPGPRKPPEGTLSFRGTLTAGLQSLCKAVSRRRGPSTPSALSRTGTWARACPCTASLEVNMWGCTVP